MFDRFTDRARKVMNLAKSEAQRLNHEYIGTEHILLGLVQEGSGVAANVLRSMGIELKRIRAENAQVASARANTKRVDNFLESFIWPVKGRISGVYGSQRVLNGEPRRPHFGIDIAAPTGTPIVAPAGGTVVLAEKDHFFTGGIIIIDHGYSLSSTLFHMDTVEVEVGQVVAQGDRVGTVGATGRATGPHLDWRMNWGKERLDPQLVVGPMPE